MIEQAELTVAILGVVVGTCACALAEYNRRWKNYWAKEAEAARDAVAHWQNKHFFACRELLDALDQAKEYFVVYRDTEAQLRQIERQRSETTRKGNATRAAARKALIASRTAQLDREIAGKTERMAA